jgi:rubrerythrin
MKTHKNTARIFSVLLTAGLCASLPGLLRAAGEAGAAAPNQAPGASAQAAVLKTTLEDVQKAFTLEMNAKIRYETWAAQADVETNKSASALLRAAALSESIHAAKHADMLKKRGVTQMPKEDLRPVVKSTRENLEAALKSAQDDAALYPAFIKQAEESGRSDIIMSLKGAAASTESHVKLFGQAVKEFAAWKKGEAKSFAVCQVCGFTMMEPAPKTCPICSAPEDKFTIVK